MRHTRQYYLRRLHRYMGVTIGIQFLLWTIGGLYFSWSDMDEIHGDYQRRPVPLLVPVPLTQPALLELAPRQETH